MRWLVRFVAERVSVALDPALSGPEATVEVALSNGTTVTARCTHMRGSPESPLTTAQAQAKFHRYAAPRLSPDHVDGVVQAVARLEEVGSVREFMGMPRARVV